jgi:2',3'-cyclic-nucleotide 2'-phosphodiesterase (5'-nucleotidase family)
MNISFYFFTIIGIIYAPLIFAQSIDCNPQLTSKIDSFQNELNSTLNKVILNNKNPLTRAQPESTIGNWIVDAIGKTTWPSGTNNGIVLFPYYLITSNYIPPYSFSNKTLYSLCDPSLDFYKIELEGRVVKQIIDTIIAKGGWPLFGVQVNLENNTVSEILIHKIPLHDSRIYELIIPESLTWYKPFEGLYQALLSKKFTGINAIEYFRKYISTTKPNVHYEYSLENRINYAE